jgi:hypothetical protein
VIADLAAGPLDQIPAWLGLLEHRARHVDHGRAVLGAAWRSLQLVVRLEAVEGNAVCRAGAGSVRAHLRVEDPSASAALASRLGPAEVMV